MDENKGIELVKEFSKSALSQREFCSKHNIKRSTLRYCNRQIMHTLTKSKNITTAHLRFKWAVSVKV